MKTRDFICNAQQYLSLGASRVLDCGCGSGDGILHFSDDFSIVAFDSDKSVAEGLQLKVNNLGREDNIKVYCNNVLTFPYSLADFQEMDMVICTNVLHFLSDYPASKALAKMMGCVKKSGIFAFSYVMDKKGLPDIIPGVLLESLQPLEMRCEKIFDKGHEGCPEPHEHMVFYFIGQKR